jgi:hypothetical protein
MKVTFLKAKQQLRKRYDEHGKHSYPNAFEFSSTTITVPNIQAFHAATLANANEGNCLLKGVVTRNLNFESRAGSTDRDEPTEWICFDADGLKSVSDSVSFLTRVNLPGISNVLQWSSSALLRHGSNLDTDFNAHIFMKLDKPVSPHRLKLWLKKLNFECFPDDITLAASNVALRWGLDITTCQNDKLLFIAPPDVHPPYEDTLTPDERITFNKLACDEVPTANLGLDDLDPDEIRKLEIEKINQLRLEKGLSKKRATSFNMKGSNVEYLPSPSEATITGMKEDRGFVYFNLNGGDSWAYYHPANNHEYIFNFKGEPTYKTRELLPSYYKEISDKISRDRAGGKQVIGFRGLQDGAMYNGFYDDQTEDLELHMARRGQDVLSFLKEYGIELENLPTFRLTHDPHYTGPRVDAENKRVNLFVRSKLEAEATSDTRPTPVIDKIINHVMGNETSYFLNWLAFIVQYKTASGVGWVTQGVQGTGKGLLFNRIMRPILGYGNTIQVRTANFEDNYNGFLENRLLVGVDEVDIPESRREKLISGDMKNYMTEPTITIRKMYSNAYEVPNHANFFFSSNKRNPVSVDTTDRRFNIASYQSVPLSISPEEVERIADELPAFMWQMLCYPVNVRQAKTAKITEAKKNMQALSQTSVDEIADALIYGRARVLFEYCEDVEGITDFDQRVLYQEYNRIVQDIICNDKTKFTRNELRTIFEATVGRTPATPAKFTKYLRHHGIEVGLNKIDGEAHRGSYVTRWTDPEDWFALTRRQYNVMKVVSADKVVEAADSLKESDSG